MPSHSVTHTSPPRLVHLSSVSPILNHASFFVRGRIHLVFRDPHRRVLRLRLTSLHPPASPDADEPTIDLFLHGRWRAACRGLQAHNVLQIDAPHVASSADTAIHSYCLELHDPIPDLRPSARPALSVLADPALTTLSSVSYDTLSGRPLPAHAPDPTRSPIRRIQQRVRASTAPIAREYTYSSIADLWDRTEGSTTIPTRGDKAHFYGVVLDARAPCTTRGPDLRSEILVADPTSRLHGEFRTMIIYCFERKPENAIPFRAVGDVVRAHRVHVGRYTDNMTGVSTPQAVARFYSTLLLWSHEGTDFEPIEARQPVRASGSGGERDEAVTHSITDRDREMITSLRAWTKKFLFRQHRSVKPYLRTVKEVVQALPGTSFLSKSFDLLCCVQEETQMQNVNGRLKVVVSDAFTTPGHGVPLLRVESENSMDQLEHDPGSQFQAFCPTWQTRPAGPTAWLVIRDVMIRDEGSQRVAVMSVGRKTSTLVWQSVNSPLVGTLREKFEGERVLPDDTSGIPQPDKSVSPQKRGTIELARASPTAQNLNGTTPESSKRLKLWETDAEPGLNGPSHAGSYNKNARVCCRPTVDLDISSIAGLREAVSKKRLQPHRIRARARSCSVPRDTRNFCQPWCSRCKKFMKVNGDAKIVECLKCARTLHMARRAAIEWSYCVCLNLEDLTGRRLDVWIEGEESAVFFEGFPAVDLRVDKDRRLQLLKLFQAILSAEVEVDCCVVPYEYEDAHGLCHVAAKVFSTKLIDDVR